MWEYCTSLDKSLLQNGTSVIFKHSNRCSISTMALERIKSVKSDIDNIASFFLIDVIKDRPLSLEIADYLNVEHASPQLIILKEGNIVHQASHNGIQAADLLDQL